MIQKQQSLIEAANALARSERGAAIIEYIGFFPLVLLVLVIAWQFVLVGYTGIIAVGAACEGVRAAATREDVDRAVRNTSPGFDGRRQWQPLAGYPCSGYSSHPVTIQVQLEVPHVLFPFVGSLGSYPKVTRRATVRCEPPPIARIDGSHGSMSKV